MGEQFCPHCMAMLKDGDAYCGVCGGDVNGKAAAHHLPIGAVLRSDKGHTFLFGEVKGEGGFGLTYIGKELKSGKVVAIKEFFPARCQPQRMADGGVCPATQAAEIYAHGMRSFLSEASMLRAVGHIPSIVHVLDYFEAGNTAYMVMEYLDGTTLKDVMEQRPRIPLATLLPMLMPLMKDMEELHEAGVLHRDIAPDNIMWMPDRTLRLLDFGCARSIEDGRSMTVMLKPGFAPIEQYQTRGQGPYTDIYALCASIYYCITGKIPPAAPERLTAVFDGLADPLVSPAALGADISTEQEQVLLWGLSIQPTIRPQKIEEFAARFFSAAPEPPAPPVPEPEPPLPTITDLGQTTQPEEKKRSFWESYGKQILIGAAVAVAVAVIIGLFL